jgi:hypothetical protein
MNYIAENPEEQGSQDFRIAIAKDRGLTNGGDILFEAGHWSEFPNTMAHLRVSDMYNEEGESVLFIDEMQSDWHREARDIRADKVKALMKKGMTKKEAEKEVPRNFGYLPKGTTSQPQVDFSGVETLGIARKYRTANDPRTDVDTAQNLYDIIDDQLIGLTEELKVLGLPEPYSIRLTAHGFELIKQSFLFDGAFTVLQRESIDELVRDTANTVNVDEADSKPFGAPDAPMKQTDTWVTMLFRRALSEAVAKNIDVIQIAGGEIQANRYDLSKEVEDMDITMPEEEGPIAHTVFINLINGADPLRLSVGKDGRIIKQQNMRDNIIGKKLNEVIGKPVAEKILASEERFSLSGQELSELALVDTGLMTLYDEMIPNLVAKIIKKMDKEAKVEHKKLVLEEGREIDPIEYERARYLNLTSNSEIRGSVSFRDSDGVKWKAQRFVADHPMFFHKINLGYDGSTVEKISREQFVDAMMGMEKVPVEGKDTDITEIKITDKMREEVKSEGVALYQRGRKLANSQVIRGQTQFLAEGQMIIDLFATGDILTLSHEFAHALSPYMDNNMRDTLANEVVDKYYPKLKGKARDAQVKAHTRAWDLFAEDQNNETLAKEPRTKELLVRMQEHMATQFELYLAKDIAPSGKLAGVFKLTRSRMLTSYQEIRKLPVKYQKVSHNLAVNFDHLLAGESALLRDQKRVVELKDEETGEMKSYTVHQSRPQLEKHKTLLDYLARGYRANDGGMAQLIAYTQELLGSVSADNMRHIQVVKNKKEALAYIKAVDVQLANRQEAHLESIRNKIKKKIKRFRKKKDISPEVRALAESLMESFDPRKQTKKRVNKVNALRKVLDNLETNFGEVPATLKDLQDMQNFEKMNLYNMSEEALETLLASLEELLDMNTEEITKIRDADMARLQEMDEAMELENRTNNWYLRGQKKSMGKTGNLVTNLKANLAGNLRTFYAFSMGPNSVWQQLADQLVEGRRVQLENKAKFEDFLRSISESVPVHGISSELGKVAENEKIEVEMLNARNLPVKVKITVGQLMMWYGWIQNRDGRKHLLGQGVFFEEISERYHFSSPESLVTTVDQLDQQYKDIVDKTMAFYDQVVHGMVSTVYKRQNGMSLRKVENYLPLTIEWKGRDLVRDINLDSIGQDTKQWVKKRIKDQDFLHMRSGGKNAVYDTDFFANIANNLANVAEYVGMSEAVRDTRVVLLGGGEQVGTASYQVKRMFGVRGFQELKNWLDRLEDSSNTEANWVRNMTKLTHNVRKAILKTSVSISFIQFMSIWGANNYGIKAKHIAASTARSGFILRPKFNKEALIARDPAMRERFEHTPMLFRQDDVKGGQTRSMWKGQTPVWDQLSQAKTMRDFLDIAMRTEEGMLAALKYMDMCALSIQLEAIEKQGKKEGWSKEEIDRRFLQIVRNTQPGNDPLFTSNFLSSKSAFVKLIYGPFQSQRDAIRGEIQTWTMEFINKVNGQGKPGISYLNCVNRILKPTLIANAFVAAIQTAISSIGRDDDEEVWIAIATQMTMNTLGLLPVLGDVGSAWVGSTVKGFDFNPNQALVLAPLVKFKAQMDKGYTQWKKGYEDKAVREWLSGILAMTQYMGTSWSTLDRQIAKLEKEFE